MFRTRKLIATHLYILITVLVLFCSYGNTADIPEEVEKYFQKIDKTYGEAKTYQAEVQLEVELAIGEKEHNSSLSSDLAWTKPSKIRVKTKEDKTGTLMISDGKKYIKYLPAEKEYIVKPAPENIRSSEPMHSGVMGQVGGINDIIAANKPSDILRENLIKAALKKETKINEQPCAVIGLEKETRGRNVKIDLFVTKKDANLLRMVFDNKGFLPDEEEGGKRIFTIKENHKQIRINEEIPEDTFSFQPPKGVKKVDEFTFARRLKEKRNEKPDARALEGETAPDFTLKDLNGKTHTLSEYKGKCVAIDFWASFCRPCKIELPSLQKLAEKYKSKGMVLLTINSESKEKIKQFLKQNDLNITVLLDPEGKASQNYNVMYIPQLVLIDKKGVVHKVHIGLMNEESLEKEFQQLLSAK